jgi:hypothetical protein
MQYQIGMPMAARNPSALGFLNPVFAKHTLTSSKRRINTVIRLAFTYRDQSNWSIKPYFQFVGPFGGSYFIMDGSKIIGNDRMCL